MRIRTLAPAAALAVGALLACSAAGAVSAGELPVAPAPAGAAADASAATGAATVAAGVHRIGGADRYAVSAAISADTFGAVTSVPVAYMVSGENFADALSASALAGQLGGPVLLTKKDSLPDAVRNELGRIHPARIVVLGGIASVSDAAYRELLPLAPVVDRIGGADRFVVSAVAARDALGQTDTAVSFVASGENFPDALSGAAAAGHVGGPVLLVRQAAVPVPVFEELEREKPSEIKVLGGRAAVSDTVVATLLNEIQPSTARYGGKDRFEVSALTSAVFFGTASTVYIASGENFPDALSGAAAAIVKEAPVLLVGRSTIPAPIVAELERLKPSSIVVLGGPAAIDASVEAQLATYLKK